MSKFAATLNLVCDDKNFSTEVEEFLRVKNIKVEINTKKETDYQLFVYNVAEKNVGQTSQLLNELNGLQNYKGKTCLLLITGSDAGTNSLEEALEITRPYLGDGKNDLRLVIAYDLIAPQSEQPVSRFQQWLCQIVKEKKVSVSSDGNNQIFPISVSDLCDLIVKSLFIANTSGEIFTAAGEGVTDLEIAYLLKNSLQKKEDTLDINLDSHQQKNTHNPTEETIQTQALLNWLPQSSLQEDLDELVKKRIEIGNTEESPPAHLQPLRKIGPTIIIPETKSGPHLLSKIKRKLEKLNSPKEETNKELHQVERKGLLSLSLIIIVIFLIVTIIPFVLTAASLYLATTQTYQALGQIREGDEKKAQQTLSQAKFWQGMTSTSFKSIIPIGNLISKDITLSTNNYILIINHSQDVIQRVVDTYTLSNQLYLILLGKKTGDTRPLISSINVNLIDLSDKLSQIQLLLSQTELPFGYGEKIKVGDYNQQINLLKSQITLSLPLLNLIDKIAGNLNQQRYLVLIQDPNELRASGGFLSSYLLITLDQGKIINLQADSSLAVDRLIEGKVEAPAVIKQLLGKETWTFHDSNLDADFPASAKQAGWFYERFKSTTLDGIIGLNLTFYRFLLQEVGNITLSDGTKVGEDNLYQLASNPTTSKASDTITMLTQTLSQKLGQGDLSFAKLSRALLKTLASNEITLWFKDNALESYTKTANLAGSPQNASCHPQLSASGCIADTVYLNESNFSVAKINFYLHRDAKYSVQIGNDGSVKYTLTYNYIFPVPAPTNLGQLYKAYYQLYLPNQSSELIINLDNQPVDDKSIIKSLFAGLAKIEFSAGLSLNQPHTLQISFTSPHSLNIKKPQIPYTLAILKQPGTMNDSLTVSLNYPKILYPRLMTVPLKQNGPTELDFQASPISEENIGVLFKNTAL